MKKEELFESMIGLDDDLLLRSEKRVRNISWMRWAGVAACFALLLGVSIPMLKPFTVAEEEGTTFTDDARENPIKYAISEAEEDTAAIDDYRGSIINDTIVVSEAEKGKLEDEEKMSEAEKGKLEGSDGTIEDASVSTIEDAPADDHGSYREAVDSNNVTKDTAEFFGGSYLDDNGSFVVVLTEDTAENRTAICKELDIQEKDTTFKTGTYTLAYLTELQEKISKGMINKEIPFVVTSGVYETINRIKVGVTTNDEVKLSQLYELDTMGGAIEVEYISAAFTDKLMECK